MQATFECGQFAVFDDVLHAAQLEALWRHLQFVPLRPVDRGAPWSPWHLSDGEPMSGSSAHITSDQTGGRDGGPGPAAASRPGAYPTGTPVDLVIERLVELAPSLERWIGRQGADWVVASATPWIYPAGTGLSWHADGGGYTGAYIYYCHPVWEAHWGGELLVAHESCRSSYSSATELAPHSSEERSAWRFDSRETTRRLLEPGIGQMVMAKPNRLIVLQGGHPHRIARVDPTAGDHVRASIAGFFACAEMLQAPAPPSGEDGPGPVRVVGPSEPAERSGTRAS